MTFPGTYVGTDELRASRRYRIELPVVVATRLCDQKGLIVDVSRHGIKVRGVKAPPRSRVCVHFGGQWAEGRVRWAMPRDGIGIVFDYPLRTGPLASIWQRCHEDSVAFRKRLHPARPVFGRRRA